MESDRYKNDDLIKKAKAEIDLLRYIEQTTSSTGKALKANLVRINPCPMCGHKDHFDVHTDTNSYYSHSGCCNGGDIINFIEEYHKITRKDAIDKIKDLFCGYGDTKTNKLKRSLPVKNEVPTETLPPSNYDFTKLINSLNMNVSNTDYFIKRGFSQELIDKYKLGYSPDGYNAALKDYPELQNKIKRNSAYNFIIPIWDIDDKCRYFIVRRNDSKFTEEELKNNKIKIINMKKDDGNGNLLAGPIRIFNDRYIKNPSLTDKYIVLCEGWADALSIEEIGYHSIALNSTSNVKVILELIKENKKNLNDKVLIIAGDKDSAGFGMNDKLEKGLKSLNINFDIYIIPHYGDFNQWITLDKQGFKDTFDNYLKSLEDKIKNRNNSEEPPRVKGIFEHNNCYCKWVGKDDDFTLKEITNFIIEPLELISIEGKTMELSANIIRKDGKKVKRTFNISDLMGGYQKFKKTLQQLLIFDGKDSELEAIKRIIISKDFSNKRGVTHTGFHFIDNKWVYIGGSKAIDQDLNLVDDIVMLKSYSRLDTTLLDVEPITKDELELIASKLFRFNDISKTATIIGHTCAIFLKEKLWSQKINFNHLFIIGEAGSGKSQTVRHIVRPLLGLTQNPTDAGNCTKFAIIRTAASSNTMPFIIEEYKPSKIGKFIINEISEFLRNSYDHYQAIRGNADQSVNEYDMLTPAILVGEDGTEETALIERSLQVNFSKIESQSGSCSASFNQLKENSLLLSKLGRALLNEALKIDPSEAKRIHDEYLNKFVNKDISSTRINNSIANAMTGITLLKKVFNTAGVDFSLIGFTPNEILEGINKSAFVDLLNENKTSKSAVDIIIEIFDRMADPSANRIWEGVHYKVNSGENLLYLDVKGIYDIFRKYVSEFRINECEILTQTQFTKQLRNAPYFNDYNNQRLYTDALRQSSKQKRCYSLKIDKLMEKELDLSNLIPIKEESLAETAITENVIPLR